MPREALRSPDFASHRSLKPTNHKLRRAGCPRPRIQPRGVMQYWRVRVLRQFGIAPCVRGVWECFLGARLIEVSTGWTVRNGNVKALLRSADAELRRAYFAGLGLALSWAPAKFDSSQWQRESPPTLG